jgi:hypothetical protein
VILTPTVALEILTISARRSFGALATTLAPEILDDLWRDDRSAQLQQKALPRFLAISGARIVRITEKIFDCEKISS